MAIMAGLALAVSSIHAADTLINSDFEGSLGSWTTAGGSASLYTYSSGTNLASTGTGAANLPKTSTGILTLTSALPLATSGYTSLTISFKHKWLSGSSTRRGYVQYAPDGVTWGNLAYVTSSNTTVPATVTLNEGVSGANAVTSTNMTEDSGGYNGAAFTDTAKFRFLNTASAAADVRWYVDDVVITATPNAAPPTITGVATATAFTTTYGTPSAAQAFIVGGTNLTANLVATAPTGFEVSSNGTTYASTATFTQSGGTASGSLSIRFAATAPVAGTYDGQNIVLSSTSATSVNIVTAASGNAVTAKTLTVTATGPLKPFGTALTAVSGASEFTSAGLVNGETITSVTLTPDAAGLSAATPLGDPYLVTPSDATGAGGFLTGNYAITYVDYNGTVGGSVLSVSNSPQTYSGSPQAATVTNPVAGTVSNVRYDGSSTVPTNVGTYAITADFAPTDTVTYSSLTGAPAGDFVIQKATPTATLAVSNSPATYDGSAKAATVGLTVSSVPGTVANILTGGAATQTAAGTYAVTADFVPTDTANYNSLLAQSAGCFVIDKATPTATLAVNNSPATYNGSAKAATVAITASSVPGVVANILTGGAATQTNAGTYPVTADFVPTDTANYNSLLVQSAGSFVIDKATPTATLAVNNSPVIFDGSAKAATVGITASSVPGAVANILTGGAATQTAAGTYPVTADFVPTDTANYNSLLAQSAGDFVIEDATAPTLVIVQVVSAAAYNSGTDTTSITVEFTGEPGQTYQMAYSTDLMTWSTPSGYSTGTGTFQATFTSSGNLAAAWAARMFFRASH